MTCAVATCDKAVQTRGWCAGHYGRWKKHRDVQADRPLRVRFDLEAQLMSKVQKDPAGHWLWTGHINKQTGYGMVNVDGRPTGAHRALWQLFHGTIPAGHEPDHVCRVRHCVNVTDPSHIEVVTQQENKRRAHAANPRTRCKRGHVFDESNTIHRRSGGRTCRTCKNAATRTSYHLAKEMRPA